MKSLRTIALKEAQNRTSPDVKAPSTKISEFFGSNVFDKKKMRDFLSKEVYEKLISSKIQIICSSTTTTFMFQSN